MRSLFMEEGTMSHFTEVECDFDQTNEQELVEALEEKFGEGHVEVYENGSALHGYHGDNRADLAESDPNYAPPCEIVIRRRHVGAAANDIGFKRTENGKYKAYISEYDSGSHYNKKHQGIVQQSYNMKVTEKVLKSQGYRVKKSVTEKGKVVISYSRFTK